MVRREKGRRPGLMEARWSRDEATIISLPELYFSDLAETTLGAKLQFATMAAKQEKEELLYDDEDKPTVWSSVVRFAGAVRKCR